MISRQYTNIRDEEKIFRYSPGSLFLVQEYADARISKNRGRDVCECHLEQEFQPKLHQPRIRASRRARHHPEIRIVCRAANRVWRRELRPIKEVEELRPEFQSQPFIAPKPRPLKNRKIKIADSLCS
jgi:hypothetical protein